MPNEQEVLALQRSAGNRAVAEVLQAPGQSLEPSTRREMEEHFHTDLSDVRLHTDPRAAMSARSIHAAAYTVGRNVVFGPERYAPETAEGRRLLAHELAHVLQQSGASGSRTTPAVAETEAQRAGFQVANAQPASVHAGVGVGVQRQPDNDEDLPNAKRKADLPEEGLTERSERSETARHKSRIGERIELSVSERHHALPKFLGGKKIQQLVKLPYEMHYMYHRELYHLLERELKRLGKLTGRTSWKQFGKVFQSLTPAEQDEVLKKVQDHADEFDNRRTKSGKKYSDMYRSKKTLGGQMRKEIARVRPKVAAKKGGKTSATSGAAKQTAKQKAAKQTPAKQVPIKTSPQAPKIAGKVGAPVSTTAAPKGRLGGLKGAGATAAGLALDIASIALMNYVYGKIAANEQAKFNEIEPEIQARVAALAAQALELQSQLNGKSMYVTVTITPVYSIVEDKKPYEGGEFTGLSEVVVDSVKLGTEYRSKYSEGERKVTASDGWYVTMYERRDTIETSFLYPYDPSVMELSEIARRVDENARDAQNFRLLPADVRQALADERKILDVRASELLLELPPPSVQAEPKTKPEVQQESLWEIGTRTLDRARRLRATGSTSETSEWAMLGELWAAVGAIEARQASGFTQQEEKDALLTLKRALLKEIGRYMDVKAGRGDFLR